MNFEQYKKEIYNKKHVLKVQNRSIPKSRIHFDTPLDAQAAYSLVSNPDNVAKHWFLPFIGFEQRTRKIKDHNGLSRRASKKRSLRYSANQDGYIYAYYSHLLTEKYENLIKDTPLENSVLAYRSLGKSNIEFAKEIFDWISQIKECNVLTIDLSSFFDTLDHGILKEQWQRVNGVRSLSDDHYLVFKSLTNYSFLDIEEALSALGWSNKSTRKEENEKTPNPLRKKTSKPYQALNDFRSIRKQKITEPNGVIRHLIQKPPKIDGQRYGIPQGSPMSAILSNIYMIEFDNYCCELVNNIGGIYRRYCDDIILVFPQNINVSGIYKTIEELLLNHGGKQLKINPSKVEKIKFTCISGKLKAIDIDTNAAKPLQYLGFIYDGQKILIRSSSLSNYYRRLISKIRASKNKARRSGTKTYRRKIYRMYSHLAEKQRNFITYTYRASEIMNELSVKKQLSNHWNRIQDELKR
nr:antiviral reverse transcriptase Drt2 [Acinetobacter tandoii]